MVVSMQATPGAMFTRAAIALMMNDGAVSQAAHFAQERWPDQPGIGMYLRAAVGGTGTDAGTGAALVVPGTSEFLGLVTPRTILGRLARLRRVPFWRGAALATGGATFGWVGPNAPIPAGQLAWTPASLPPLSFGGIAVVHGDLLTLATPAAEQAITDVLVDAAVRFMDASLVSAAAAVANTSPAGLRAGVVPIASVADPAADLTALLAGFVSLDGVSVVMSERNAVALALAAPGAISAGKLAGVVPLVASSAAGTNVIAVRGPEVLYADEGVMTVDTAEHAAVQMDDAPDNPSDAATVLTSLWQMGAKGLKLQRNINWQAGAGAVAVVENAAW
jgi:hypothetical protein